MRPACFLSALAALLFPACVDNHEPYHPATMSSPLAASWRDARLLQAHQAATTTFQAAVRLQAQLTLLKDGRKLTAENVDLARQRLAETSLAWSTVAIHQGCHEALDTPDAAHPQGLNFLSQIGQSPARLEAITAVIEADPRATAADLRAAHMLYDDDACLTGLAALQVMLYAGASAQEQVAYLSDPDYGSARRRYLINAAQILVDDLNRIARETSPYVARNLAAIERTFPESLVTGRAILSLQRQLLAAPPAERSRLLPLWSATSPQGRELGLKLLPGPDVQLRADMDLLFQPDATQATIRATLGRFATAIGADLQAAAASPHVRSLSDWPQRRNTKKTDQVFGIKKRDELYQKDPNEPDNIRDTAL